MAWTFIGTSAGIIGANYLFQFLRANPDWSLANERSWFQAIALIAVAAALIIKNRERE